MIDKKHNFIFVHINKTAGTSVHYFFNQGRLAQKNKNVKSYINYLGKNKFEKFFVWTIVRNPWDRIVSLYLHRERKKKKFIYATKYNFVEWVKLAFGNDKRLTPNWSFDTCSNWLKNNKRKINVDFICKFEQLDEDWKKLCKKLNIKHRELPKKNTSKTRKGRHYKEFYKNDKEAIEIIENFYKEDINNFGYTF